MNKTLTILSTRELGETLVEKIISRDIIFDQVPFIEMTQRCSEALQKQLRELAALPLLVIFTSRVAVASVVSMLDEKPDHWNIACMGGATRKAAAGFFGEKQIAVTAANSKELAERLAAMPQTNEWFFFCGNRRMNDLPETLQLDNKHFTELVVYDTTETPSAISQSYDAVLFFSPSAAESFFSVNSVPASTILFSIGETTAITLRRLCNNPVVVSAVHSPEVLLDTMFHYFATEA